MRQLHKRIVSGGVRGLPIFSAARRWQRAPAPSRRSVRSGTLATDVRHERQEEPVACGMAERRERLEAEGIGARNRARARRRKPSDHGCKTLAGVLAR
jgi:hypothetical protein